MKKILQFLFVSIVLFGLAPSSYAIVCDQVFEGTYLRYDKTYRFYDVLHNSTNRNVYVNTRKIRFMDNMTSNEVMTSSYLDPGSPFDWTQQLRNANYTVAPNSSMRIIETGATKWRVDRHPTTRTQARRNSHDFMIYYKVDYDFSNNYPNASDDISHVECQYFSVTWCGDGVRDTGYEVCDPNDPTRTGWGNGGCNNSCQPITVNPPATCDGLTVNPTSGQAPFTTTLTCSGTNATSYQIQCGNGQVINSRTGTCSYPTGSNYQAQCIVDGNITSNACKKTVTVTNPNPGIRIDKLDANQNDLDGSIGNDTQTVATGTQAVFKIRVTNSGNEPLKNLKVIDSIAPNCGGNVTLPSTKPATWSNFTVAGSGNHSNNTLEVGEYFEYTCVKPNTTSAYDNQATTQGTGTISNQNVSDVDDTEVLLVTPSIQIVKLDANQNDLDGSIGNDTQTVKEGEAAIFKIRVTNDGTEDLKNIVITDQVEPNCGGNVTLPSTKPATWSNFTVAGSGNHSDAYLQPGEYFEYTCQKTNTQTNYTNTAKVDAKGKDSNSSVMDTDPTDVIVQPLVYDLALIKRLSTSTPGPFAIGDTVTFDIIVTNQGEKDAFNVEITDYIPLGLTLNDGNWTGNATSVTRVLSSIPKMSSQTISITFTINNQASGSITNYAEISADNGDDCDSTADAVNGNTSGETTQTGMVNDDIGTGCNTGGDEDDHDLETIIIGGDYDLALIKRLSTSTPGPFAIGDTVTFDIIVTNQGGLGANNIEITDYIPVGLTLNDAAWTQSGGLAIRTISSITSGNSVTLPITFTINNQASGSITNYAEISADNGDDCDSTADAVNGNTSGETTQTGMVNDDIGTGCNTGGDEDDHDLETIIIGGGNIPACINLSATPTSGVSSVSSTVVCTGENVTTFKIDCGNGATFTGSGSNNGTETFTKTCNYTVVGTYTPTCYVDNTITNNSCQKTVTVSGTSSSSSSSSSGGTPAVCNTITKSGDSVTCNGNDMTKYFRVDCGNGTPLQVKQAVFIPNTGRTEAVFDCDFTNNVQTYNAKCEVTKNNTPLSTSWSSRPQCELSTSPTFCGDGILQRPNDNGENEQCERVINADGTVGAFPENCTNQCRFTGGSSSSSSSGGSTSSSSGGSSGSGCTNPNGCNIITIPNHGDIVFGPIGNVIIGHGTNPLVENGEYPFIRNDSDYDLYFDELCVKLTSGNSLDGSTTQCTPLNDVLYPGEKVELNPYPVYQGNKNNVPAGQSYGSNVITTTIKTDGTLYDWAYFAADLDVRVSKPAIATTGGGTSFVKDTSKMSDVYDVAIANKDDNKNFVGTAVSGGNVSSYTSEVTDSSSVAQVENSATISESVNKVEDVAATLATVTSLTNTEIKNYNGLANVYILKGTNLVIDTIPASLSGARTYIIQDANLIINGNLTYPDNIAFVVKGGNIQVNSSVTELTGTYISIPVSGIGGDIEGIGGNTDNILTVRGSLYGDVTNLVDKRTYISNDTTTGQINVGTIVSFGSQVFKQPAPLVGQFISEYLDSEKVAQ